MSQVKIYSEGTKYKEFGVIRTSETSGQGSVVDRDRIPPIVRPRSDVSEMEDRMRQFGSSLPEIEGLDRLIRAYSLSGDVTGLVEVPVSGSDGLSERSIYLVSYNNERLIDASLRLGVEEEELEALLRAADSES